MPRFSVLVGLVSILLLGGCYTVPETGRSSLIIISPSEEANIGKTEFANLRTSQPVSVNAEHNARVTRIGRRIAEAVGADLPHAEWEFVVFEGAQTVNAFALPGGKVGVFSGMLAICETDDELAAVIGHEIAHITARHGAERMSQNVVAGVLAVGTTILTEKSSNRDLWRLVYGGTAVGARLAFSRGHEREADYIGVRYAAKAGYDPRAAISFWQRMSAAQGDTNGAASRIKALLSTHPSNRDRIAALEAAMPTVLPLYEQAKARYK